MINLDYAGMRRDLVEMANRAQERTDTEEIHRLPALFEFRHECIKFALEIGYGRSLLEGSVIYR